MTQQGSQQTVRQRSFMDNARLFGGIGAVALLLLFFLSNFQEAEIKFLWMEWDIAMIWALLLSALVGAIAAWLFSTIRGRGRQRALRQ